MTSDYQALFHNTKGDSNTANGDRALFCNTEGFDNTAVGFRRSWVTPPALAARLMVFERS